MKRGHVIQGSGDDLTTLAVSKGVHTLISMQAREWGLPVGHTTELLIRLGFEQLKQRYAEKKSENPLKIMSE